MYKNYVVHPDTVTMAHLAGCAAGKQGKFMSFKKVFWDKGFAEYAKSGDASAMGEDAIMKWIPELELDAARFQADIAGNECRKLLAADMAEMAKFGVNGTPSFFINGKASMFGGIEALKSIIDRELREVEQSNIPPSEYYQKAVIEQGSKKFVSKAERGG